MSWLCRDPCEHSESARAVPEAFCCYQEVQLELRRVLRKLQEASLTGQRNMPCHIAHTTPNLIPHTKLHKIDTCCAWLPCTASLRCTRSCPHKTSSLASPSSSELPATFEHVSFSRARQVLSLKQERRALEDVSTLLYHTQPTTSRPIISHTIPHHILCSPLLAVQLSAQAGHHLTSVYGACSCHSTYFH